MKLAGPAAAGRAYAERMMVDRATVERDQAVTTDPYGGTSPDWQTHLTDQRCKQWVATGRTAVSEDRTALVEDWKLAVPLGTDVRVGDRVTSIADGSGRQVTGDILYVDHVADKRVQLVCDLERRG